MRIKCKTCIETYCEFCFVRTLTDKNACSVCKSPISDYFTKTDKYLFENN